MDLEKIERALERCRDLNEVVKHSDATDGDHERLFKECMVTVTLFGPDLLRLVRAMRWLSANADMLSRPCSGSRWNVGVIGTLDSFTGDNPIAAIEAAMNNQPRAT